MDALKLGKEGADEINKHLLAICGLGISIHSGLKMVARNLYMRLPYNEHAEETVEKIDLMIQALELTKEQLRAKPEEDAHVAV